MKHFKSILTASFSILISITLHSQIEVIEEIDGPLAVQNILLGDGIEVDNISFSGTNEQIGYFNSSNSNIGLQDGVILATGSIQAAIGPNNTTSHTEGNGIPNANDPDLELLAGAETNDAAVLEFDFIPSSDSISFRYVFASEEYNEYVCSNFNDAFGFFLSGPGINGEFENNAINIALIPNSDIQVTINTLNNGNSGAFGQENVCAESDPNWQNNDEYFIDNSENMSFESVQYDGFTVVLTAKSEVQCGESYHIKLAIADAFDDNLDSAVFLEASSLNSSNLHVEASITNPNPSNINSIVEGCVDGVVLLTRPDIATEETIDMTISGTAENGVDYELINESAFFSAGENSIQIPIIPLGDELLEGEETIIIEFHYINSCGDNTSSTIEFNLVDYIPLSVSSSESINLCPDEQTSLSIEITEGLSPYEILWNTSETNSSIEVNSAGNYTVTVTDFCQTTIENSITVNIPEEFSVTSLEPLCIDDQFILELTGGTEPFSIDYDTELIEYDSELLYTGFYEGQTTISIIDQCGTEIELEIVIDNCSMIIPNVFTPNQDGMNDYFRISGIENYPNSGLSIFNRWGNLVFQSDNYQNNWDGYLANQGTYFYVFERSDGESFQGELSLFIGK